MVLKHLITSFKILIPVIPCITLNYAANYYCAVVIEFSYLKYYGPRKRRLSNDIVP